MTASVDILIPHYENTHGLEVSLNSIFHQEFSGSIRVVVCDDGSANIRMVEDIVSRYAGTIELARHDQNLGRPFARNTLLRSVKSEFVAWLDAGDVWEASKLEKQLNFLGAVEDNDSIWVTCSYHVNTKGKIHSRRQNTAGDQTHSLFLGNSLRAYLWTTFCTARSMEQLGLFDVNLPRLQDLDMFLRFRFAGGKLHSIDGPPLATYVKDGDTTNHKQVFDGYKYILSKHRHMYIRYGRDFERKLKHDNAMKVANIAAGQRDRNAALRYQLAAASVQPSTLIPMILTGVRKRLVRRMGKT